MIAFVNTEKYIRHRDIWDLRCLSMQGAQINPDLLINKIKDYKISDYNLKLDKKILALPDIVASKAFLDKLKRFIPVSIQERTIDKPKFLLFLSNEVVSTLQKVSDVLSHNQF